MLAFKPLMSGRLLRLVSVALFSFRAEDGIRDGHVTGVQTCALPISGKKLKQYTFHQNYYWCLGDNRPFSIDSRHWGLVPEDHIIGLSRRTMWSRPLSSESDKNKIRWKRIYHPLR